MRACCVTTSRLMTHDLWKRAISPSASAAMSRSNGVSCTFRPGELTAIVGPNGAGKTTYFNLISGQLRRQHGQHVCSTAKTSPIFAAPARTRAGLGRAFQLTNLFPNLSVEENVRLAVQADSRRPLRHAATVDDAHET